MIFSTQAAQLGFGCMRLKMTDGKVDYPEFCRMIDAYLSAGFCYFDTAHGYIGGQSETALRDCLVARHPRGSFMLADKLSAWYIEKEEDVLPFFESQLALCGVEYFDVYFLHSVARDAYEKHQRCKSFETLKALKEEGKIRHIAMSFHDSAAVLDRILSEQPCIEAVQIQLNYLDYDDPIVQSRACYDVAVKHKKEVIVMEPVKGGALAALPEEAREVLDSLGGGHSCASYALRFAAGLPAVRMVLSGMGSMEMMEDNINTFRTLMPLSEEERAATARVAKIIRTARLIPCTGCTYCTEVCPKKIPIPTLFSFHNRLLLGDMTPEETEHFLLTEKLLAGECMACGECEKLCPQSIDIRACLKKTYNL